MSKRFLRAVVSYWRKYVHKVLVNRLGGLSLPRKSVVRLTDRPDMTLDVYGGRKTTMQRHQTFSFPNINTYLVFIEASLCMVINKSALKMAILQTSVILK